MSLTTCLKKAGSALNAEDKAAILKAAAAYRKQGLGATDAGRKAVDERIAAVQAMLDAPAEVEAPVAETGEAAPAAQPDRGPLPALPVAAYRLERRYANGAVVRPLPGKTFTLDEVTSIGDWFKAAGWEVGAQLPSGISGLNNAGMTMDDIPEPYTAAQRKRDEAAQAADERASAKKSEQGTYLSNSPAGAFVREKFGDALNSFNATAMAKFLDGTDATFAGLLSNRAAETLDAMGIASEGRATKDILADIKAKYEAPPAQPEAEQGGAPEAQGAVENFGEELPPARRNMAAKLDEDLSDDDIAKRPLSEIWPLAENEAIEDNFAAAVAHAARAEIPAKPRVAYKVRNWVMKVKAVRGLAAHVLSGRLTRERLMDEVKGPRASLKDWATKVMLLERLPREKWNRIGAVEERPDAFTYNDKSERIPTPMVRVEIDGKAHWLTGDQGGNPDDGGTVDGNMRRINELLGDQAPEKLMQFEVRGRGPYKINKKGDPEYRTLKTFDSTKEAFAFIKDQYGELVAEWEQIKARDNITERDLRSADNRPRAGKDHRGGKDVTPEQFQERFGFKGGEWGKWVSQGKGDKERQALLNSAYDALMDLSDIVGIPPRAISLNGTLGIAFGSRGSGWASAHFEPSNLVINLTKTRGAGALAHEWLHAADNYFARQRRGGEESPFTGDQAKYRNENYITHRPETLMIRKDRSRYFPPMTRGKLEAMHEAKKAQTDNYSPDKWEIDPSAPNGVRPEVEARFAALVQALNDSPMTRRSQLLDKGKGGYWSSTLERAARAFESFVIARMHENGYHNDFLVNVKKSDETGKADDRYPYLLAGEVKPIADAFDALFGEIQTRTDDAGNVAMFSRQDQAYSQANDQWEADDTASGRRYVGVLDAAIRYYLGPRRGTAVHPYEPRRLPDGVAAIAEAFGTRAQGFRLRPDLLAEQRKDYNFFSGVYLKKPNLVLLNEKAQRPHLAILGHELAHQMATRQPDLYRKFTDAIRPYVDQQKYRDLFAKSDVAKNVREPDKVREEFMGEVLSDGMMDPGFWRALGNKNPSLLQKVGRFVREMLVKAMAAGGYRRRAQPYLTDFDRVMQLAGEAMAEFGVADARGEGISFAAETEGQEAMFSRAPAEAGKLAAQDLVNAKGGVFDFNRLGETKQDRVRTIVDGARPFWLGALTRDQMADMFGDDMPAVRDYDSLTRLMENERQKLAQDADKLYTEWAELDQETNDKLSRVMLDATIYQVHPDQATPPKGADTKTAMVHARLRREFDAMPAEAKAMYGKVKAFHQDTLTQLRDAVLGRLDRQVQNGEAKQAALSKVRLMFDQYLGSGPYFPLSRFGDFLVVGNREKDGERVVAAYETAGEQQAAARALVADGFKVKMTVSKTYSRQADGSAGKFIGDVLATIEKVDMTEATINGSRTDLKNQLLDDLNQMFIRSLPDLSYRKHFMHRKGTPGFSADAMRGFASSAFHAASHIARLNHGDRMTFALDNAYQEVSGDTEGDFNKRTQVLNELTKRHEAALNPTTHPIAAMLNQVGFVMYLGLSPAAGLVNLLQTPMVTLPHLGARYGFGKATSVMGKATKDIMAAPMNKHSGWDATASDKLSTAEKAAMRELQDEGVIDLTQAHDLAAASGLDTGNVARSRAAFAIARAMKIVGWTFHVPEVMNRQVTALAAYRLEMEKTGDREKAKDAAREAIKRTHFDYSMSNRARYMQGNVARVVMQFKQYSQNMTYLLGRAAQQALNGESPEVRRIARRQLVATLGATFAMAGTLGLPALGAAMGMIEALVSALDDEDEPWDWKVEFRNLMADQFGREVGEVMAHGIPRALMPWDVSGRVGMGELWFRSSDREGQNPREAFATDVGNILGPTAGTLLGWYTAADHMARGDYSKATESIMPKFIRDPLKAMRENRDGITSYTGEPLMETSAAEEIGRLLGFAPASASEMYSGRNAVMNAKTAIEEKRSRLLAQAAKARIDRDAETLKEVREKIGEFNRRNPQFRITGDHISRSVRNRLRNRRNTEAGLMLPDTKDFLRERGRFAVAE